MKIRQAQTSATYILPDPGELNKRVLIRQRVDMPADNFGVEPQYPVTFRTWAKVIQTSATTWQETAQTGDAITHYITIRYRRGTFDTVHASLDGKTSNRTAILALVGCY